MTVANQSLESCNFRWCDNSWALPVYLHVERVIHALGTEGDRTQLKLRLGLLVRNYVGMNID